MLKGIFLVLSLIILSYALWISLRIIWRALKGLFGGRPHETWDDIKDYDFQKELNERRKKMGVPQRNISKYKRCTNKRC